MKKLLNTIYITKPDYYLAREGSNLVIREEDHKVFQCPIQYIESVILFTYAGISSSLIELAMENNVSVTFLSPFGHYRGSVHGEINGNVLLRKEQYRISESPEDAVYYARNFIFAKIYNSMKTLQRFLRDHSDLSNRGKMERTVELLKESKKIAYEAKNTESLMGIEGDASRNYFQVFNDLIRNSNFSFNGRSRRPPLDAVNAMLSFGYGLLRVRMESALESVGLDPYVGFHHQDRPGRTGLALDLMEELRPFMVDRFVLGIINNQQMTPKDFVVQESGAVLFTEDGQKKFLELWNARLQEPLKHPFIEETVNVGLIPYIQALLLARTIRGDLELYPPFIIE